MSTGLGGGLIYGTPEGITSAQATVTVTDAKRGNRSNFFRDHAGRVNWGRPMRQLHLRYGRRLRDQDSRRLYDYNFSLGADDGHDLLE